jgi:predicted nucleic acid-binding protein
MVAISNSSPLILYARIGRLELLRDVFTQIFVPQAVYDEIVVAGVNRPGATAIWAASWVSIQAIAQWPTDQPMLAALGAGEAQAIILALQLGKQIAVLLDDEKGRRVARQLGIRVYGSAGVLVLAKEGGMISLVRPVLDELRAAGLYLSDPTYNRALALAGELPER